MKSGCFLKSVEPSYRGFELEGGICISSDSSLQSVLESSISGAPVHRRLVELHDGILQGLDPSAGLSLVFRALDDTLKVEFELLPRRLSG